MKLYKIVFNSYDYDQYDSFIIRAKNEQSVETLLLKNHSNDNINWKDGFKIIEIKQQGDEEVILGSYNAG